MINFLGLKKIHSAAYTVEEVLYPRVLHLISIYAKLFASNICVLFLWEQDNLTKFLVGAFLFKIVLVGQRYSIGNSC